MSVMKTVIIIELARGSISIAITIYSYPQRYSCMLMTMLSCRPLHVQLCTCVCTCARVHVLRIRGLKLRRCERTET